MISILLPVYNTPPQFLIPCLESCLNQTIDDYEIVIVDNGSSLRGTIVVLEAYVANHDKITILKCPRHPPIEDKKNLAVALNCGLRTCSYDLIARMDSDDLMLSHRLEKQLNYFQTNPHVDILGAQLQFIHAKNQGTNHAPIVTKEMALSTYWFINHPTVMYRRSKILEIGGYKESPQYFAEDYDLWLRAMASGMQIHNLPDVLIQYRLHSGNLTRQTEKHPQYISLMNEAREKLKAGRSDIS